jgi:hypothetical protein
MAARVNYARQRVLREMTANITFADTAQTYIIDLPAGARVIDIRLQVKVVLDGVAKTLDIGTMSDVDYFANDVSCAAVGVVVPTVLHPGFEAESVTAITVTVAAGNTTGDIDVTFIFSAPGSNLV